jgi:hypothetical protein
MQVYQCNEKSNFETDSISDRKSALEANAGKFSGVEAVSYCILDETRMLNK